MQYLTRQQVAGLSNLALSTRLERLDKSRNGHIARQGTARAREIVYIREELRLRHEPLPPRRKARRIPLAA